MKSNQVIFGDLSNSAKQKFMDCFNVWLTKHRWVSEKDVHYGNVFFISIVGHLVLIERLVRSQVWWISINLDERRYQLPISHRVWILQSQRPRPLINVACCLVPVRLQDAWLPHRQGSQVHVAKWTQVQIPWITWPECKFPTLLTLEIIKKFGLWSIPSHICICNYVIEHCLKTNHIFGLHLNSAEETFGK